MILHGKPVLKGKRKKKKKKKLTWCQLTHRWSTHKGGGGEGAQIDAYKRV
jgi:hypothetical protein